MIGFAQKWGGRSLMAIGASTVLGGAAAVGMASVKTPLSSYSQFKSRSKISFRDKCREDLMMEHPNASQLVMFLSLAAIQTKTETASSWSFLSGSRPGKYKHHRTGIKQSLNPYASTLRTSDHSCTCSWNQINSINWELQSELS